MKVRELIERLQAEDLDAEVHFTYPAGDYWKSQLVVPVEHVEELPVKHSGYHDKLVLVDDEDDDSENNVVVLQA